MKSIILDNGIEYLIISSKTIDNETYTLFANINDESDICLRKTKYINNKEYYVGLDNKEEIDKVILHFTKDNLK